MVCCRKKILIPDIQKVDDSRFYQLLWLNSEKLRFFL